MAFENHRDSSYSRGILENTW